MIRESGDLAIGHVLLPFVHTNGLGAWTRRKEPVVPSPFHQSIIGLRVIFAPSAGLFLTPTSALAAGLVGTLIDPDGRCLTAGGRVATR